MLMKLIERLTGRTRRIVQPHHASAAIPIEKRAALIEAQVDADIKRRELDIAVIWDEVRAIAGKAPATSDQMKGPNTKP